MCRNYPHAKHKAIFVFSNANAIYMEQIWIIEWMAYVSVDS